jgi:hypothetical protein
LRGPETPTPQRCLEAYHLNGTRLELIAERKVRRRQLTDDGNIEITGRDLRERDFRSSAGITFSRVAMRAAQQAARDAERRFRVRIRLAVPDRGFGQRINQIPEWLDQNAGADGWAMTPSGIRGVLNDAISIHLADAMIASAFVARCAR